MFEVVEANNNVSFLFTGKIGPFVFTVVCLLTASILFCLVFCMPCRECYLLCGSDLLSTFRLTHVYWGPVGSLLACRPFCHSLEMVAAAIFSLLHDLAMMPVP